MFHVKDVQTSTVTFTSIIHLQRHRVEEIPIADVRTEWKGKEINYWVYGREHQVFCSKYPFKCSIL